MLEKFDGAALPLASIQTCLQLVPPVLSVSAGNAEASSQLARGEDMVKGGGEA